MLFRSLPGCQLDAAGAHDGALAKDAPTRAANRSIKQVLGYALVKDFRQRLCELDSPLAQRIAA